MTKNKPAKVPKIGLGSAPEYLNEVVLPAYRQFDQSPKRASAIIFAVVAWHMHAHLWHHLDKPGKRKNFAEKMISACPELSLIRDFCDAGKHYELDRPSVTLDGLEGSEGGGMGHYFTLWGATASPERGTLALVKADGARHDVHQVFRRVVEFWQSQV